MARERDRGQALGLLMMVVAITAVVVVAVGHTGSVLIQHQRARSAADAAALAAVTGGRLAAEATCRANGCRVVQLRSTAGRVEIIVDLAGVQARASASS
jgi:Tfp pilus assembly protein FimT